jgi:predicted amidohydrolase YtcJ
LRGKMEKARFGTDMVVLNGRIVTMDKQMSVVEAIAISGGRISALGSIEDIKPLMGPNTRVVNLERKTALPGFIDAHYHLQLASCTLGLMAQCHTPPNKTIDDVILRLQEWEPKVSSGRWVIGQGCLLQERKMKDLRFPTRYDLDRVSRDRPVALRFGMHVTILNSKALEILCINKDTALPKGSAFDIDPSNGEPTGVTRDFWNYIPFPDPDEEQVTQAIEDNIRKFCLPNGITSVHDLPETTLALKIYQKLLAKGNLPIRIRFYYEIPNMIKMDELIASGLGQGFGNDFLRLGGIKIFVDGGITSAGACFHEAYDFNKNHYGNLALDQEELNRYVLEANEAGLQVLIHAVGDRAMDIALDAVEKAQEACYRPDHRHRIEHMGNVYPQMHRFKRTKQLGVLPVPNMGFINSWGDQVEYLLGKERARSGFWCKTLIDEGFPIPGSSDATGTHPENTNPFFCISCAINRKTFSGKVISPEEKISMAEAIKMYTNYSAYAGFEENQKGSLELGKLGDLIVISRDPWDVPDSEIADIKVICTIVGGRVVYNPSGL